MNLGSTKSFLGGLQSNLKGKVFIKEKILIIESDDWGAIRTPSVDALKAFEKQGFDLNKSIYKVDGLASQSDLENLFDLLLSFKDREGRHPAFTANAIMANPDFERIKASDFQFYFFEPFTETFKKYPEHANNLNVWKKGMNQGIFHPQFHGREHLNIGRWMRALQKPDPKVRFTFDWQSTYSGVEDYAFMEAYDWTFPEEIEHHKQIILEGLEIFRQTFGFPSKSFIAPCYNWDSQLEPMLAENGVEWIQGIGSQMSPTGVFNRYLPIKHVFGDMNPHGSRYTVRNVFFEPIYDPQKDWTDAAMARIHAAFLLNRPAVISTHRVNYVGFIDPKNRDNGLWQLKKLLTSIIKKWPEVKFITTDQLSDFLQK